MAFDKTQFETISDGNLLSKFADKGDQSAFEELVRRHGRMVHQVGVRILNSPADADDVLQTTFMALARSAGRLSDYDSIAGWLHVTARRSAIKTSKSLVNSQQILPESYLPGPTAPPDLEANRDELFTILHSEIDCLPDNLRTAVILCDLEGLSREDAARRLRIGSSTVSDRVAKGRQQLHARLVQRGVTVSLAGLTAALLTSSGYSNGLDLALLERTTDFACSGQSAAKCLPSAPIRTTTRVIRSLQHLARSKTSICLWFLLLGAIHLSLPLSRPPSLVRSSGRAETMSFFENFSDGDILDGSPVSWDASFGTPHPTLTKAGLRIVGIPSPGGPNAGGIGPSVPLLGDHSIRVRLLVEEGAAGLATRFGPGPAGNVNDGYFLQLNANGLLTGTYRVNNILHEVASAVVSPVAGSGREVWLQLSMTEGRVEGWCWEIGTRPPTTPQISFAQSCGPVSGLMGIYSQSGSVTIRSAHVSKSAQQVPRSTELAWRANDVVAPIAVSTAKILSADP